jgi:hypothetical protein
MIAGHAKDGEESHFRKVALGARAITRLTHGARDQSPPRATSHEHTAAAMPPGRDTSPEVQASGGEQPRDLEAPDTALSDARAPEAALSAPEEAHSEVTVSGAAFGGWVPAPGEDETRGRVRVVEMRAAEAARPARELEEIAHSRKHFLVALIRQLGRDLKEREVRVVFVP